SRFRALRCFDQVAGVLESSQHMDVLSGSTRNGKPNGLGSGTYKERVIEDLLSGVQHQAFRIRFDSGHAARRACIDAVFSVILICPKRNPLFGSRAGKVILRQIRTIIGKGWVFAKKKNFSSETFVSKSFG